MDRICFLTGKGKCMYRASWDTVFAVSTTWFVYNDQKAFERKGIYRAQANACGATEATIFIDDENCVNLSGHVTGHGESHLKLTPQPLCFHYRESLPVKIKNYYLIFLW